MQRKEYKLVWSEEFNGENINHDLWSYELGYVRNKELQYYTDKEENAYLENSCLVLACMETGKPECPYTSASLTTYGTKEFLYGKIEMRAKLPYSKGIWPAFWMMGVNKKEVGHPKCGEIDIMELIGGNYKENATEGDSTIYGTIHFPGEQEVSNNNRCELLEENYCDNFHVIGIEWTPETIKWYVDGIIYNQRDIREREEFHKPFYIIVNLAFGGGWPGAPDKSTVLPQKYYIDWIRYYQ